MKEQVAEIVAAYLRKNKLDTGEIPAFITRVYEVLAGLGGGASSPEPVGAPRKPAVPIRRSVHDDFLICLDCGAKAKVLRRHLMTAHGLTPDGYRQRWNLPAGYAVVAAKYAARRSELAKTAGLGKRKGASTGSAAD